MKNSLFRICLVFVFSLYLCVARVTVEKRLCYSEPENYYRTVFWLSDVSEQTRVTCSFGCRSKNCIFAFVDINRYDFFASCLHNETMEYAEFNDKLYVDFVTLRQGYLFLIHNYERQGASFECEYSRKREMLEWYKFGLPLCLGFTIIVAVFVVMYHRQTHRNGYIKINSEI